MKKSSCDIWSQNIRLSIITLPFLVITLLNDQEIIKERLFFLTITNTNVKSFM